MANLGSITYQVKADTSSLSQSEAAVKKSTGVMSSGFFGTFTAAGLASRGIELVISKSVALGKEAVTTGMKIQQLELSFKAIAGSVQLAGEEMGFIWEQSRRLGQEFMSTADAYKGIAAAARGTSMEGKTVRDVFVAISEAGTVLGLSAEQVSGSLYAISQMISKGKVSSEELRQQLGERLPGAFQIAAQSMNMTTQEFDKFVADGKLMTEDFLPKFAKLLHEKNAGSVADSANSARAATNRLSNAWTKLVDTIWKQNEASYTSYLKWQTSVVSNMEKIVRLGPPTKSAMSMSDIMYGIGPMSMPGPPAKQQGFWNWFTSTTPFEYESTKMAPDTKGVESPEAIEAARVAQLHSSWLRSVLSDYKTTGAETFRMAASSSSAAKAQEVFNKQVEAGIKYFEKYRPALAKHNEEIAKMRQGMEAAGYAQEDIKATIAEANRQYEESINKASSWDGVLQSHQNILDMAKQYWDETRTPVENYNLTIEQLRYLLSYLGPEFEDTYNRASKSAWDSLVKVQESSEGWREHLKIIEEGAKLYEETRTPAERYATELERINYLYEYGAIKGADSYQRALQKIRDEFDKTGDKAGEFAIQAARNIQSALGDQLYNMLTGKFDSIGKAWLELLAKMASQAAAAQIGRWLFGDFGTSNKIGGLFGDIFSGAVKWATGGSAGLSFGSEFNLASGGRVDPGSAYWVGERGPEPFFPDVAGTVISRSDLGGGSSKPPNVNVVIKHDPSMRVEKEQTDTRFDGESYHATVSLKLLKNNESYRRSMSRYLSGGR